MTLTKPPIGEVPITTFLAWECQCDSVRRAHGHDGDDDTRSVSFAGCRFGEFTLFVVCDLRRGT